MTTSEAFGNLEREFAALKEDVKRDLETKSQLVSACKHALRFIQSIPPFNEHIHLDVVEVLCDAITKASGTKHWSEDEP